MPTKCTLVIDTRERAITCYDKELEGITYIKKQITIGDYAVIDPDGKILVIIERKSLSDAAASLKDGRWENREKMFKLREQTGCKIIFIIEGLKNNNPDQLCGSSILYKTIESSLFHMMMNNVSTLWTMDTKDTACTLARFTHSMDTHVCKKDSLSPIIEIFGGETPTEYNELLTQKHVKTDHEISRDLWSCFHGIADTTADEFIQKFTLGDVIMGRVTQQELDKFKYISGRKISKKLMESMTNIDSSLEIRLLSCIPGISTQTAKMVIEQTPLKHLLSYEVEALSNIKGKGRNLGEDRAKRIKQLFSYKV